jgi:tRNA-binding EMAP/Myf-like protein
MYTLIYLAKFPSTLFLQIHQSVLVTHQKRIDDDFFLYADDQLIGVNLTIPNSIQSELNVGIIRHASNTLLTFLETRLNAINLPFSCRPYQSGFVKARIVKKDVHPDADALFVCQVSLGTTSIQVVTNSTTIQEGNDVVVARSGAILLDGHMLETTFMLKQKTEGMLCSQKTLGIEPITQHGVFPCAWRDDELGDDYYAKP